jgi:hypothetical protein
MLLNFNNHCADMSNLKIRSSFGRGIPRILWKLDVHRCIRRRPPPVLMLRQINLVRAPYSTFWKSTVTKSFHLSLGLPSGLFPPGFSHQKPVCTSPLLLTCHKPRLSHSSSYYHPNNIWCTAHITQLLTVLSSPLPFYLVPSRKPWAYVPPSMW